MHNYTLTANNEKGWTLVKLPMKINDQWLMYINWLEGAEVGEAHEEELIPQWSSEGRWRPCILAVGALLQLRSAWPPSCWVPFLWQPRYSP